MEQNPPAIPENLKTTLALEKHIRTYVYVFCILLAIFLYVFAVLRFKNITQAEVFLTQMYGFVALDLLYLTLTPGLVKVFFPKWTFDIVLVKAARALGVSTFVFALLHAAAGFIVYYSYDLNNIINAELPTKIAFAAGTASLTILFLLTITSFDKAISVMGPKRWKTLHRFVYIAAILSLIHMFLRGAHFKSLDDPVGIFFSALSFVFLVLELTATLIKSFRMRAATKLSENQAVEN